MCVCVCVCVRACVRVRTYVCACARVRAYVCMRSCMHTCMHAPCMHLVCKMSLNVKLGLIYEEVIFLAVSNTQHFSQLPKSHQQN